MSDPASPTWQALEEIVGGLEGGQIGCVRLSDGSNRRRLRSTSVWTYDALSAGPVENDGRSLPIAETDAWIRACGYADLIWLELEIADVTAICAAKRESRRPFGGRQYFATPLNQRPLALGADILM